MPLILHQRRRKFHKRHALENKKRINKTHTQHMLCYRSWITQEKITEQYLNSLLIELFHRNTNSIKNCENLKFSSNYIVTSRKGTAVHPFSGGTKHGRLNFQLSRASAQFFKVSSHSNF